MLSETPEYSAWRAMIARCNNPKNPKYARYGGRGISVCQRWMASFHAFLEDVGQRPFPSASIGRIDNDGNYEPENVRWETHTQQMRNTSWNHYVTIGGITKTVSAWAADSGLNDKTIRNRITDGWPSEKLLLPSGQRAKKLSAENIFEIRRLKKQKLKLKDIAILHGVTVSMVNKILSGESWQQVPVEVAVTA